MRFLAEQFPPSVRGEANQRIADLFLVDRGRVRIRRWHCDPPLSHVTMEMLSGELVLYFRDCTYATCEVAKRPVIKTLHEVGRYAIGIVWNDGHDSIFRSSQLFYANELIREYYKIRWLPGDIITGYRELRTGIVANFSDILRKQSSFVIQYICKIRSYYIGFDVVIIYDKHNLKSSYEKAADYHIKLAGYNREYYYMLFPFRYYFRHNKAVARIRKYYRDQIWPI